jgi:hypothetical protein
MVPGDSLTPLNEEALTCLKFEYMFDFDSAKSLRLSLETKERLFLFPLVVAQELVFLLLEPPCRISQMSPQA